MVEIWTGQYRYSGQDRLDVTVKGQHQLGGLFAPTWDMVQGIKRHQLSNEAYTTEYVSLMNRRYKEAPEIFKSVLQMDVVTFVCFCPAGAFCHRVILAQIFTQIGAVYRGERVG